MLYTNINPKVILAEFHLRVTLLLTEKIPTNKIYITMKKSSVFMLVFMCGFYAKAQKVLRTEKTDNMGILNEVNATSATNVTSYDAYHEIAGPEEYNSKVHLLLKESNAGFPRIRFINGLYSTPANNRFWDLAGNVYGSPFFNDRFILNYGNDNVLTVLPNKTLGIGRAPSAVLDIASSLNGWDLVGGNPGDLRIGSNAYNFRVGVATGGGGAGHTNLYSSGQMIFGVAGSPKVIINTVGIGSNMFAPLAKVHTYGTGEVFSINGSNTYKASAIFEGMHPSENHNYHSVGVYGSSHSVFTSSSRNNTGVWGTAGVTGFDNHGVKGSIIGSSSASRFIYGVHGDVDQGGAGSAYGIYGIASGSGSGKKYGVYGEATTGGSGVKYGVYGVAPAGTGNYAGYFSGSVYTTGTYQTSDEILKSNISPIDQATEMIMKLQPSTYVYKTEGFAHANLEAGNRYGFTAQNVQSVFPNLVKETYLHTENREETGKKILAVNYTELIPVLTKALQELQGEIVNLKKELTTLKNK